MRVTRPPVPLPVMVKRSTLWAWANRSTAGEYILVCSVISGAGPPEPVGPTGATSLSSTPVRSMAVGWEYWLSVSNFTALSGSSPSTAISAITAPIETVSPSSTRILDNVPVAGAGTSIATLSVTTSTRASYFWTLSPACVSHWPIMASVTDSPTCGSSIFIFALSSSLGDKKISYLDSI